MALTTEQLLERAMALLPPGAKPLRPLVAGVCGALALTGLVGDDLFAKATIGGASGIWLTLLARGQGVYRTSGESDASLRIRCRNAEDQLTKAAIKAAVDALIDPSTCTVVEHWAAPYMTLDVSAACDVTILYDQHRAFTVEVPTGIGDDAYRSVATEVDRIKLAGVRAYLRVE